MQISIRIYNIIGRITTGKSWLVVTTLLLTALALFFSFPSYPDLNPTEWEPLFKKADNLFDNSTYNDGTHAAKLTFRLVLPMMVHYLHLDITGVLILLGIAGMLNFYLVVRLANTVLQNRQQAFIIGLCTAFIYMGKCSFTELRGTMFDGLAMFFLLCALNARYSLLSILFVFLAAWTDERGLFASALVWLFYVVRSEKEKTMARLLNAKSTCLFAAWIGYIGLRYYLARHYGLHADSKGVGLSILLDQINNIPLGLWSALEGLWIIVLYGAMLLYSNKRYAELLKFIAISGFILLLGLSVVDITRSVMFVYPAVFVSLVLVKKYTDEVMLNRVLWMALVLCFVYPAYYTGGKSSVWWTYPLPLQMLR